jgi:hypothetical protein
MSEQGYNGWTNYETWVTKLWIDNDQGEQAFWLHEANDVLKTYPEEEGKQIASLSDQMKEYCEYGIEEVLTKASLYADLMRSAIDAVNWNEIARSVIEEAKEIGE